MATCPKCHKHILDHTDVNWLHGDVCECEPVEDLTGDLCKALDGLLERYVELINSGDAGFWDPEKEKEVIAARAALAKARGTK